MDPLAELPLLNPKQFGRFRDFIYQKCGILVDDRKVSMLSHRLRGRLKAGDFDDFDSYYQHLTSIQGRLELEHFLDAVTTNETYFFRTPGHFDWFKTDFLRDITLAERAGERQKKLKVWSAACSTGEEVYSLAICVRENSLRLRDWDIQIIGTDISEAVLKQARVGSYRKRAIDEMDPSRVRRWFQAHTSQPQWTIRNELRHHTRFVNHNLMDRFIEGPFDCIFIRNVLIYFNRDSKTKVIDHLIASLAPGGYLVVGPSEGIYDMLEPLEKVNSFLYRKAGK